MESLKTEIKPSEYKANSNGYRNWERFRNRVMYVLNDDATYYMYPKKKD